MTVSRVELTSIEAKRFARPNERIGAVRIDHNSSVLLIKETSPTEASVEFRYTATYGGIGVIKLEGNLSFSGDAHKLQEQWQQSAQMPNEIASEIHTAVMRVCVPEAVGIAKNLNLPPPIPLPQVQFGQTAPPAPPPGKGHTDPSFV